MGHTWQFGIPPSSSPSDQISMFPDLDHFPSLNFKNTRLDSRNNTNCQSMDQQVSLEVQCFNQNSPNTTWCDSDSFWSSLPQIASFLRILSFIPRLQEFMLYNRGYAPTNKITIRIPKTLKFSYQQQITVLKWDWATTPIVNYSRLNGRQNWVDLHDHLRRKIIFTLETNKIFVWTPKIMRKWIHARFEFANHLTPIACFIFYKK